MTDTYAKLLGLAGGDTPDIKIEKVDDKPKALSATLLANQQTSKEVKKQVPPEIEKSQPKRHAAARSSPAAALPTKPDTSLLTTKEKTKYGTYLTNESIQKISILAIQTNRDAHQVVQEAVNQYLEKLGK